MKLVIVDRDGTLNVEREGFLQSPDDWQALPGALDAIARLNHAGFQVVIAANWPGLGRGQVDMATVNAIHARMNKQLAAAGGRIEAIYFCPTRRTKAAPAASRSRACCARSASATRSTWRVHAVGNSASDAQAAQAAGCRVHLVLTGRGAPARTDPLPPEFPAGTQVHADLAAFATALIAADEAAHPEPQSSPA
jgi:D-glycero-D-manno-heptose 1,7-bisphosphate phosphatase